MHSLFMAVLWAGEFFSTKEYMLPVMNCSNCSIVNTTEPAQMLAAQQRIAFIVAGASHGSLDAMRSLAINLIRPLCANPASAIFVDVILAPSRIPHKPGIDSTGTDDGLADMFAASVCPQLASLRVSNTSAALAPTMNSFWPVALCAWGCKKRAGGGRRLAYCQSRLVLIYNWWGRMARVWRQVEAWEATAGRGLRFESVLLARPDIVYRTALKASAVAELDTTRFWYSALEPPDGLWFFNRQVAQDAMRTAVKLSIRTTREGRGGEPSSRGSSSRVSNSRGKSASKCRSPQPTSYLFSWFAMCYWADEHWKTGGRVRLFDGINASVLLRTRAIENILVSTMGMPPPLGFSMSRRPRTLSKGRETCGWVWPNNI